MYVRKLHQIEMTSNCNLRCKYCAHPTMTRPKVDMDEATYMKALGWVRRFVAGGQQREVNLAGIGESTMHPDFVRFVHLAREYAGPDVLIVVTTNGLLVTDDLVRAVAPAKPAFFVSLHRPEKAGPAIEILKRYRLLAGASADPSLAATDWAGQVKWHVSAPTGPCVWLHEGKLIALADGRVSRCSFDAHGVGVCGTLDDDLTKIEIRPYDLCVKCNQTVPDSMKVAAAA